VAAYLARFKGTSREHTESDLRCSLSWCAEHVRRRAVSAESLASGFTRLQFEALLTAARQSPHPCDFALVALPGLLGLRTFEATSTDIADLGELAPVCSLAPGSQVSRADQRRITGGAHASRLQFIYDISLRPRARLRADDQYSSTRSDRPAACIVCMPTGRQKRPDLPLWGHRAWSSGSGQPVGRTASTGPGVQPSRAVRTSSRPICHRRRFVR
jgi:hypothetical protein